jgi:2,3-bisphosphoglycerate-independent phosphoglycerate mutase
MKYLVIICNGLSDKPVAERNNKTPLQLAKKPNLDRLAQDGLTGSVCTIPENLSAGRDVSYLSLLGYDAEKYYSGYAPFEASALGIELLEGEVALCCDFIFLQSSHDDMIMKDFSAGQLTDEDSGLLLTAMNEQIQGKVQFYPGRGPHNIMVMKSPPFSERLLPPNELIGEGLRQFLTNQGEGKELAYIMNQAQIILHHHPYNKEKVKQGLDAVNSVWIWGNGQLQDMPKFNDLFGKHASLISASLLFEGMADAAGIKHISVDGATGGLESNFNGKVSAALKELDEQDVVYLNIAAAEDISLKGNIDDKIKAIEKFDNDVIEPLRKELETRKDVRMMVVENHLSSVNFMKYHKDPVPFVVYPPLKKADKVQKYDEEIVQDSVTHFKSGHSLIEAFLQNKL